MDADWATDKTPRRSMSGGVVTLGGGVLNCWAKKQKECCIGKLGKRAVRSHHVGHEIFRDLGYNCSATVATDSQSVADHSKRCGHSVASKHVGLRGLWLQEVQVDWN